MIVRFVLWSLADSHITIPELREYVRTEASVAFSHVPGLLFKAWIADEHTERWGAISPLRERRGAEQSMPSRARELIGKDPTSSRSSTSRRTVSVSDAARPPRPRFA